MYTNVRVCVRERVRERTASAAVRAFILCLPRWSCFSGGGGGSVALRTCVRGVCACLCVRVRLCALRVYIYMTLRTRPRAIRRNAARVDYRLEPNVADGRYTWDNINGGGGSSTLHDELAQTR